MLGTFALWSSLSDFDLITLRRNPESWPDLNFARSARPGQNYFCLSCSSLREPTKGALRNADLFRTYY